MSSVTLERIITADELLGRWPGLVESELAGMLNTSENNEPVLRAYWHDKTLITPEKNRIHICTDCSPEPDTHMNGDTTYFDWGGNDVSLGIVCDLSTVEQIEKLHPEYLYRVARNGEQLENPTDPDAGYWINCDTLYQKWHCSPFDVVEAIKKKGLNLDAHYSNQYLQHDTLNGFSVHSVDLAKFEAKHAAYIASLSEVLDSLFWETMNKAERLAFPSLHETLLTGDRPTHSLQEIVKGLLKQLEEGPNEPEVDAKRKTPKGSTTNVEYCISRVPDIVDATWKVKEKWDALDSDHEFRAQGIPHSRLIGWIGQFTNRDILNAVKDHLAEEHGVVFRAKN